MLKDCLFCKIINGDISAKIIKKNKKACAFHDINPQADTHILIVPNKHIESTRELSNDNINYLSEMALLANQVSVIEEISNNGYRWVINTGNDGGQTVDHIHLHLIGGRKMLWPPG